MISKTARLKELVDRNERRWDCAEEAEQIGGKE